MRPARSRPALAPAAVPSAARLGLMAVSLVGAAGCCRLFGDAGWVAPVLAAVVGAHALGALGGRWTGRAALAAQAGGLALLLAESVGGHTAHGLPTPATLTALVRVAARAPDALRAAIVPAPTTPELLVWVVAGLWIATATADALARRRRAGLSAVLPLAVFPVVVAALGTGRQRAPLTFAFAAATALYAALDRAAALPVTHALVLRPPPATAGRGLHRFIPGGVPGRAGPALAVGLAAVVLGPVVPGLGRAVVDVHALGVMLDVSRVELNPLVDIRPQLLTDRRTELFTVRAPAPAYWRLTALDRFDGRRWSPSRPALFRHEGAESHPAAATADRALDQDFRLTALDSPWLPAADRAIRVTAAGARLDPETDSLVTKKGSRAVRAYRVESRLPRERVDQLPAASAGRPPGLARYLALPNRFPSRVRELAQRFTAGAATPYDRALALEDSLRVGFIYDETAPPGASLDALDHFLFSARRGYCEQFAGAYAAMARAVGLPARVAVGFTPGAYDEVAGVWRVTTREAHAWPEVFLDGIGWTAFEPTPGRVLPGPETRLRLDAGPHLAAAARASGAGGGPSNLARVDPGGGAGVDAGPGGRSGGLAGAVAHSRTLWWLGLGALGLVAFPPAAKTRRRSRRRRARADEAVLAAWREALDRLDEARLPRRSAETPLEFARRAGAVRPGLAPAIRHLAGLVNGAAYGPGPAAAGAGAGAGGRDDAGPADGGKGADAGAEAWAAADGVVRALDAHDPGWERWRRRLDPRPLLPR
ncbi:MAG: hypothetical protein QOD57_1877 [Actinomycetota bacterium]|nr:hypothetical protein [Actinomycetota bacterium]